MKPDGLEHLEKFLTDLVDCHDLTEPAADGGITVGMVFQQDAKWMRTLLARHRNHSRPDEDEVERLWRLAVAANVSYNAAGKLYPDASKSDKWAEYVREGDRLKAEFRATIAALSRTYEQGIEDG